VRADSVGEAVIEAGWQVPGALLLASRTRHDGPPNASIDFLRKS